MMRLLMLFGLLALTAILAVAEPAGTSSRPVQPRTAVELKAEIDAVLTAREQALTALNDRYKTALPEERAALETEGSQLQAEYERAYLTLAIEYHRLTGNAAQMAEAQQMLEALDAPTTVDGQIEYRSTDRHLPPVHTDADNAGTEGVVSDAQ